ncbi:hypothetical protein KAR48_08960 [bacterium]|nr:hypothetical protein [bacterium]
MEWLLIGIVVILVLYATGKLSSANEDRVKSAVERIKALFSDSAGSDQ